jgi:putative transposase
MAKKRYRPEEIIGKLREADVLLSQGKKVVEVIKALGITDITYYRWRQEYGGMSVPRSGASRSWRRRTSGSGRRSRT